MKQDIYAEKATGKFTISTATGNDGKLWYVAINQEFRVWLGTNKIDAARRLKRFHGCRCYDPHAFFAGARFDSIACLGDS